MNTTARQYGILLHITSLPSDEGIGTLGAESHHFLEWLSSAGASAWQQLPLVPIGAGHSPYSSPSAFAGNPLLISLERLAQQTWLSAEEFSHYRETVRTWGQDSVKFEALTPLKQALLEQAATRFLNTEGDHLASWRAFCSTEHSWLSESALFSTLREHHCGGDPWWLWEESIKHRDPESLKELCSTYREEINLYTVIQYWFQSQWDELKAHADLLQIKLIGDVPIYVDHNSADVWSQQELFALNDDGSPQSVAGVPPDAFSSTGQLWGNPIYRWSKHLSTGYQWWVHRLRRALSLTHIVRIDHFRAFAAYWSIPFGSPDARTGIWIKGPGLSLFRALSTALAEEGSPLPLIAEDLGLIDQPVRDLLSATQLPGMKVLQFAFDGDTHNSYLPHQYSSPHCVVYTGTHDNETTREWWSSADERTRHQVRMYCAISGDEDYICWDMIRLAFSSIAELAVIPLQDLLSLGEDARMNIPSAPSGNWGWRVREEALNTEVSNKAYDLASMFARLPLSVPSTSADDR